MAGMPSARGSEMKGKDSMEHFQKGYEAIPRNPDGTMVIEPPFRVQEAPVKNPPVACNKCFFVMDCPTECSHGSEDCRERLGI